jgi:hypothetical protein
MIFTFLLSTIHATEQSKLAQQAVEVSNQVLNLAIQSSEMANNAGGAVNLRNHDATTFQTLRQQEREAFQESNRITNQALKTGDRSVFDALFTLPGWGNVDDFGAGFERFGSGPESREALYAELLANAQKHNPSSNFGS